MFFDFSFGAFSLLRTVDSMSQAGAISEISALPRFGGQLHHVEPRFPRVWNRACRYIGMEFKDQTLARIVTRPRRQACAVRIAGLGEVDPVALRHSGDGQILLGRRRGWRAE